MNERDSEIMAQSLAEHGFVETMDMDHADIVILNTCSIRAKAEQKVMSLLGQLRIKKNKHPKMQICVAGCVAQQEGIDLTRRFPHINLVVGTQHIYQLPSLLSRSLQQVKIVTNLSNSYEIPQFIPNFSLDEENQLQTNNFKQIPHKKFVTIMQGCNNYCSYCVVPYTRGREVSRPAADILQEITALVKDGVREITLLGQNVNSYGQTNSVTQNASPLTFAALLKEVALIEGIRRLRFTTSNPKDLSEELMACFQEVDILCPHFHLPVQSGSNRILQKMNRKYSVEEYLDRVESLRRYSPNIALGTDMIIGFPGETDADFEKTMDLLETVRYHGSFSFKYSDRPGTRSADFSDKVPEEIKKERLSRFQKRQDAISLEQNRKYVGQKLEVMIERNDAKAVNGRSPSNHIVHIEGVVSGHSGDLVLVEINHAGKHSLKGRIVV